MGWAARAATGVYDGAGLVCGREDAVGETRADDETREQWRVWRPVNTWPMLCVCVCMCELCSEFCKAIFSRTRSLVGRRLCAAPPPLLQRLSGLLVYNVILQSDDREHLEPRDLLLVFDQHIRFEL